MKFWNDNYVFEFELLNIFYNWESSREPHAARRLCRPVADLPLTFSHRSFSAKIPRALEKFDVTVVSSEK